MLDRELEEMVQVLLDVEIALSRIVVNSMQARNRVELISYLIEWYVYHGRLAPNFSERFNKLGSRIKEKTQTRRDKVAHGLWTKRKGKWFLLRLRAQRQTPQLLPIFKKVSRAVLPETEPITREMIAATIKQIIADATEVQAFCAEIYAALAPSRYKPPQYSRRRRSNAKKTARRGPPRSSQG